MTNDAVTPINQIAFQNNNDEELIMLREENKKLVGFYFILFFFNFMYRINKKNKLRISTVEIVELISIKR